MARIGIYAIVKSERDAFNDIEGHFMKMIGKYAKLEQKNLFPKSIEKAQKEGRKQAQKAYGEALTPYFSGFKICLDPAGKTIESEGFASLLERHDQLSFFIGGAYGFDDAFRSKCDFKLSLSPLTMSHKLAKAVLLEQIYRGYTIIHNHPYHK